nr:hypothetical protein CFP56_60659 [Quercus suber]
MLGEDGVSGIIRAASRSATKLYQVHCKGSSYRLAKALRPLDRRTWGECAITGAILRLRTVAPQWPDTWLTGTATQANEARSEPRQYHHTFAGSVWRRRRERDYPRGEPKRNQTISSSLQRFVISPRKGTPPTRQAYLGRMCYHGRNPELWSSLLTIISVHTTPQLSIEVCYLSSSSCGRRAKISGQQLRSAPGSVDSSTCHEITQAFYDLYLSGHRAPTNPRD